MYYLRYVVVGGASAALSWSYGYANGYKLARNNEIRRSIERQRKRYESSNGERSRRAEKTTRAKPRRSITPQVKQRSFHSRRR